MHVLIVDLHFASNDLFSPSTNQVKKLNQWGRRVAMISSPATQQLDPHKEIQYLWSSQKTKMKVGIEYIVNGDKPSGLEPKKWRIKIRFNH